MVLYMQPSSGGAEAERKAAQAQGVVEHRATTGFSP
jgi:hypothetical protein